MASLYVDRRDVHLQHDAGAIAFYENGQRSATVPLAPITRVILRGKVTLEAGLLGHLGEHGIGLLFLTGRQGRPSLLLGRAHNDATRRVAQTRLSLDTRFCLSYASALIHRKIAAQREWFETLREHYPQARYPLTQALRQLGDQQGKLARAGSLESLRGLEGAAAASYFAGLRAVVPASLGFDERNRRPPRDPFNALLSLTLVFVPQVARIAESVTAQVRHMDYIDAARATGASALTIIRVQVLGNVLGPIFVFSTGLISVCMILASGLSFLGLGVRPPEPEWGLMLNTLRTAIYTQPWVAALPGLMIFITSISFNILADRLRAAMAIKE